jgi:hypothetical protein
LYVDSSNVFASFALLIRCLPMDDSWPVRADLQREFELARSKPRHLAPQPKASIASLRTGLGGVIDSLLAAQHVLVVLEMFRRALPDGASRHRLDRLSKPPYQNPQRSAPAWDTLKAGRDWPVMPTIRPELRWNWPLGTEPE